MFTGLKKLPEKEFFVNQIVKAFLTGVFAFKSVSGCKITTCAHSCKGKYPHVQGINQPVPVFEPAGEKAGVKVN